MASLITIAKQYPTIECIKTTLADTMYIEISQGMRRFNLSSLKPEPSRNHIGNEYMIIISNRQKYHIWHSSSWKLTVSVNTSPSVEIIFTVTFLTFFTQNVRSISMSSHMSIISVPVGVGIILIHSSPPGGVPCPPPGGVTCPPPGGVPCPPPGGVPCSPPGRVGCPPAGAVTGYGCSQIRILRRARVAFAPGTNSVAVKTMRLMKTFGTSGKVLNPFEVSWK